jgi:membrane-associated phospholipid phosphatase
MVAATSLAIVYLGVHWLVDIAAGFAFALLAAFLAQRFLGGYAQRTDRLYLKVEAWYHARFDDIHWPIK